jgi:vitamin B12 transporter
LQRLLFIAVFLTGSFAGSSLFAQSEEDTLRRYPPRTVEITAPKPSDISVVDPRQMESKPTTELRWVTASALASDALRAMSSSLDIRRYGTLGAVALPSFRGLPAQYTTVYRDGIRLTNEQLGETDLGQLTLHGISRIELVPASTAVLLGADAIGAVIDLVTVSAESNSIDLGTDQTNYAHGSGLPENSYYANASLQLSDDLSANIAGSLDQSNGRFPFYQTSTGIFVLRENNDATLHSADISAKYKVDEKSSVTFLSNYFSSERGSPGQVTTAYRGATYLDARLADQQFFSALKYERRDELSSEQIAAYYQDQYESFVARSEGLGDTGKNLLAGLNVTGNARLNDALTGYAGVEYLHSGFDGSSTILADSNSHLSRERVTAHMALAYDVISQLRLSAALRSEWISDLKEFALLPEFVGTYQPLEALRISAAYSRNFLAPTLNDLYWKSLGNSKLASENADEYEVSAEYSRNVLGVRGIFKTAYFDIRAKNAIVWLPAVGGGEAWHPINIGALQSNGAEFSLSADIPLVAKTDLRFEAGYTLLRTLNVTAGDSSNGKEILYSSPTMSNVIATINNESIGSLAFFMHYRGHKFTDDANSAAGMLRPISIYDVTLASRTFEVEGVELKAMLSVQNMLDTNYEEVLAYPLPGRTYKFSIELSYH